MDDALLSNYHWPRGTNRPATLLYCDTQIGEVLQVYPLANVTPVPQYYRRHLCGALDARSIDPIALSAVETVLTTYVRARVPLPLFSTFYMVFYT